MKPQVSMPGAMHLFCSTISVSALTPASELTVAFIVAGSKNLPPSARKRSLKKKYM